MNKKYVGCGFCKNPATHYSLHVGCSYCKGGDCGDTSCVEFYCLSHAKFFQIREEIPREVDPIDYCYELLEETQNQELANV